MTAEHQTDKYNLWDPALRANPWPVYDQMRAEDPVFCGHGPMTGAPYWFFVNYDDVQAVLRDNRFAKEARKNLEPALYTRYGWSEAEDSGPMAVINRHMLNVDPPDHTRLRALIHKAFTPRRVQDLRPRIAAIADELLDAMQDQREVDLLAAFALPLPITVIAEMLGVPAADRALFRDWTEKLLFSGNQQVAMEAAFSFGMYMQNLIDERQQQPADDILSALIAAEEDGDRLNREELMGMLFLLLVAGHETTVNLIGNGMLALMQHPEEKNLLVADPGQIRTAVEEMLRFNGPVEMPTLRFAFADIEVGGVVIPRGDAVLPVLLAANRDPNHFDKPHAFDIRRDPNPHIAFGMGIHYCVGAPLARMEGQIAINALLARFPHIDLNIDPAALRWNEGFLLHGMKALPVRLA